MRSEAARNMHLLKDVALKAFESPKAELKGDGVNGRWFSPLEVHVLPKLGKMPVAEIDQNDIRDVLAPIWHTKAETCLGHKAGGYVERAHRHTNVLDQRRVVMERWDHRSPHLGSVRCEDGQ